MIPRKLSAGLVGLVALALLGAVWWGVVGQAVAAPMVQAAPTEPPPQRERQGDPGAPTISFIDSPTAQCVQYERQKDACYIQWHYQYVSASTSQYIISMTVSIDNRMRAYYSGFFQTFMYVPQEMTSPGFRVACGPPGSGGNPNLGKSYAYTLRARETGGLKAANYGSVTCPADVVPVASVSLAGAGAGSTGVSYPFTATVSPITTTTPITYVWRASDQTPITLTSGISASQSFSWNASGDKQVVVDAFNAEGSATVTHTISIDTPISGLTASNDSPTALGEVTHLSASVAAGSNVVFTWDLGDGNTASGVGVSHTYLAEDDYIATVTASNSVSEQTATTSVHVEALGGPSIYFGYLPLLMQNTAAVASQNQMGLIRAGPLLPRR